MVVNLFAAIAEALLVIVGWVLWIAPFGVLRWPLPLGPPPAALRSPALAIMSC